MRTLICLFSMLVSVGVAGSTNSAAAQPEPSVPDDAYWDDRISPCMPGVDGHIFATTVFNGDVIVAGRFTFAGETPANAIAAWNGSSWSALGSGLRTTSRHGMGTPGPLSDLASSSATCTPSRS